MIRNFVRDREISFVKHREGEVKVYQNKCKACKKDFELGVPASYCSEECKIAAKSSKKVTRQSVVCLLCKHVWTLRGVSLPRQCPKCLKTGWDLQTPSLDEKALLRKSYETFGKTANELFRFEEAMKIFPEDLQGALHVKVKQVPCIYFLLDENNRVLYIGYSQRVGGRIDIHIANKLYGGYIADIAYVEFPTKGEARIMEGALINKYQPPLNMRGHSRDLLQENIHKAAYFRGDSLEIPTTVTEPEYKIEDVKLPPEGVIPNKAAEEEDPLKEPKPPPEPAPELPGNLPSNSTDIAVALIDEGQAAGTATKKAQEESEKKEKAKVKEEVEESIKLLHEAFSGENEGLLEDP